MNTFLLFQRLHWKWLKSSTTATKTLNIYYFYNYNLFTSYITLIKRNGNSKFNGCVSFSIRSMQFLSVRDRAAGARHPTDGVGKRPSDLINRIFVRVSRVFHVWSSPIRTFVFFLTAFWVLIAKHTYDIRLFIICWCAKWVYLSATPMTHSFVKINEIRVNRLYFPNSNVSRTPICIALYKMEFQSVQPYTKRTACCVECE